MKANEAPEKLYLHPTAKGKVGASWLTFPLTNKDVEYTKTDTFIEKATLWMEENLERHISSDGEYTINYAEISRDFKNYIKNENSN